MTMTTKNEIFAKYKRKYIKASKQQKGAILNTVCEVTGMFRKSVIRRFRRLQLKSAIDLDKRGRKEIYTPDVMAALKYVWIAANEPCGEIMHPMVAEYVRIFERDGTWKHSDEATFKLLVMSERTMKRRIGKFSKIQNKASGMTGTSPSLLKHIIPIFKGPWHDLPPGNGQIDTVAHCGNSLSGDFIWTVNYTDTATYWTILRAQWNKGQLATIQSIETIIAHMPFKVLGLHPDSGSEFINWVAKKWCDEHNIKLSRSEPNKKNDNMYVEERNGHIVRKYLGYTRLDCIEVIPLINKLYETLELYLNHFRAVRRMISKERVGSKYVRKYEKHAQTAYQRVFAHKDVLEEVKIKLQLEHEKLNPLILKKKIDSLRIKIYELNQLTRNYEKLAE